MKRPRAGYPVATRDIDREKSRDVTRILMMSMALAAVDRRAFLRYNQQ